MRLYEFTKTDEAIIMEGLLQKLPGPIQRAISKLPGRAKTVVAIVALGVAGLSPVAAQNTQSWQTPTPVSRDGRNPAPNPNDYPVQDYGTEVQMPGDAQEPTPQDIINTMKVFCSKTRHTVLAKNVIDDIYQNIKKNPATANMTDKQIEQSINYFCQELNSKSSRELDAIGNSALSK
jgi:hypothetical protein